MFDPNGRRFKIRRMEAGRKQYLGVVYKSHSISYVVTVLLSYTVIALQFSGFSDEFSDFSH